MNVNNGTNIANNDGDYQYCSETGQCFGYSDGSKRHHII